MIQARLKTSLLDNWVRYYSHETIPLLQFSLRRANVQCLRPIRCCHLVHVQIHDTAVRSGTEAAAHEKALTILDYWSLLDCSCNW